MKKQFLLSLVMLLIGISFISKLYKLPQDKVSESEGDITIMSYNVRCFNCYNWLNKNVISNISTFINQKTPDILCVQEYKGVGVDFSDYKYKFINVKKGMSVQCIFSKYPIINSGFIKFPSSTNNLIYADLMIKKDTIRVYSMHLQSTKISSDINEEIDSKRSEKIFNRLGDAFKQQLIQSDLINKHIKECTYPIIICGDMNNSAFSYVYRRIKGDLLDGFEEKGTGFGRTYNFKYYPARIDYIFTDNRMDIKAFESYDDFINSDHHPIMVRLSLANLKE